MKNRLYITFLLLIIALLFLSCGDDFDEPLNRYIYQIQNESGYDLSIEGYSESLGILNQTIFISNHTTYEKDSILSEPGDNMEVEDLLRGNLARIIFEDGKSLEYKCTSTGEGCNVDRNIFTSFTTTERDFGSEVNKFTRVYTFTENDYHRAK